MLFSTASASAITFILKAILYEEQCALGMIMKITATKGILPIDTLKRLTDIVVVVDLLSRGSIYTLCWISWYSLHWFAFFLLCLLLLIRFCG